MSRHTITHADEIFIGAAVALGVNNALRGVEISPLHQQKIIDPPAGDVDGVATSQAVGAPGAITLDGAFVTDGVATIDGPRNIVALSSNAGDSTQILTVTGTDINGNPLVGSIAMDGTTEAVGPKAFATVTSVVSDAAFAGNLTVGTTVTLGDLLFGLDAKLESLPDAIAALTQAGTADGGSFDIGDLTPAIDSDDARGTYNPGNAPDGTNDYTLWYHPDLTKDGFGTNFTG